nr:phospholipase-like protein [Tanacetum cinerariifolium]
MLRKQHKFDDSHNDMAFIYYIEGHSLHFGRSEFALIIGMRFGTISIGLYTSGDLKFCNRVFSHKLGLIVTNLDVIGVIEDEEMFGKLCDEDSIRLCLILALDVIFMGRLLTCPVDDTLFWLVKNLEAWNVFSWGEHVWTHLYDLIKNVMLKYWIEERSQRLQFNENFFRMSSDFRESLNIIFQDFIDPRDLDEDIDNDYLVEEELRLCLEEEERMRLEHQKIIDQEKSFRIEEAKRMRLKEEKMLQIAKVNKRKCLEFMNSTHVKNALAKLTTIKRNDVHSLTRTTKTKERCFTIFYSMDTVWLTDDIEQFIGQPKCKFPWSDDYTVDRNFWLRIVCLDPARKGWLSEEILLQNSMPLFYANGDKYATPWSDVHQVFILINETDQHWCLDHLDILSVLVNFYDSRDTYDYEWRDCLRDWHGFYGD